MIPYLDGEQLTEHIAVVVNLLLHHRDPFDRLIISQIMVEQIPIVGSDPGLIPS